MSTSLSCEGLVVKPYQPRSFGMKVRMARAILNGFSLGATAARHRTRPCTVSSAIRTVMITIAQGLPEGPERERAFRMAEAVGTSTVRFYERRAFWSNALSHVEHAWFLDDKKA